MSSTTTCPAIAPSENCYEPQPDGSQFSTSWPGEQFSLDTTPFFTQQEIQFFQEAKDFLNLEGILPFPEVMDDDVVMADTELKEVDQHQAPPTPEASQAEAASSHSEANTVRHVSFDDVPEVREIDADKDSEEEPEKERPEVDYDSEEFRNITFMCGFCTEEFHSGWMYFNHMDFECPEAARYRKKKGGQETSSLRFRLDKFWG